MSSKKKKKKKSWLFSQFFMPLWFPIYSDQLLICKVFVVSRTAGLPQYGQLGHGTDNEVCYYVFLFTFNTLPLIF